MDPFDLVKDDLQASLEAVRNQVDTLSFCPLPELKQRITTLRNSLSNCHEDCDVLKQTNDIVSADLSKFPSITPSLLQQRQNLVVSLQHQIDHLEASLDHSLQKYDNFIEEEKRKAASKLEEKKRREEASRSGSDWLRREQRRENDEFITSMEARRQETIKRQENEDMQRLGSTVRTLTEIGHEIQHELDDQAVLLDNLGEGLSRTQILLDATNKQITKLLRHKERGRLLCIFILAIIIVVLLFNL
ncbi:hypothetical protein RCL1_006304 [Eukaryota sp. TZLM3-RCL]